MVAGVSPVLVQVSSVEPPGSTVVGLAISKLRGTWDPTEPTFLGRAGHVAGWLALLWVTAETVNVLWPRTGDALTDWAPFIVTAALFVIGLAIRISLGLSTRGVEEEIPVTAESEA